MKQQINRILYFLVVAIICLLPKKAFSQDRYILKGTITVNPKINTVFEGADVKIKNTDLITRVSMDGKFLLELSASDVRKKLEITIEGNKSTSIKLKKLISWSVEFDNYIIYLSLINTINDSDGDGVVDTIGAPNRPVIISGDEVLADQDGDGISDKEDRCPDAPGTRANFGCPEVSESIVIDNIKRFPIPYPVPSAEYAIPWSEIKIQGVRTFDKVDKKLSEALSKCDYLEKSYYVIPHGFAIITEMEQIQEDGISLRAPSRWSNKLDKPNDFFEYIKSLANAPEGHFRVIVFLVTDVDLTTSGDTIDSDQAREIAADGYVKLPNALLTNDTFTANHSVTALIYQYKKVQGKEPILSKQLSGKVHLIKSGLASFLK